MFRDDLRNVESARSDSSAEPGAHERPGTGLRNRGKRGSVFVQALRRLWIPLVIAAVIGAGALTVSRLHGVFGTEKNLSYASTKGENSKPYSTQHLRYEIFGPPGTTAVISYFGADGDPQHADGISLPWSLEFTINGAASVGSIAAQGDTDTIGCRILVNDVVKTEKVAHHEASAFASCTLKAA